jgi:hypothetical protein
MATAAVAATAFNGLDSDVLPIIGVSLLIGLGTGLANGLLITKRSVPPFLATLAMWIVLEGCRYAYNGGAPSGNVPAFFRVIGAGGFHGVPYNTDHGRDCRRVHRHASPVDVRAQNFPGRRQSDDGAACGHPCRSRGPCLLCALRPARGDCRTHPQRLRRAGRQFRRPRL